MEATIEVKFDLTRLGTKYENSNTLKPVYGVSNGTIIAVGAMEHNIDFVTCGNKLASLLVKDENLGMALGKKFRRRFPTVWCTLGHYTNDFKIESDLKKIFDKYKTLDQTFFDIPCY